MTHAKLHAKSKQVVTAGLALAATLAVGCASSGLNGSAIDAAKAVAMARPPIPPGVQLRSTVPTGQPAPISIGLANNQPPAAAKADNKVVFPAPPPGLDRAALAPESDEIAIKGKTYSRAKILEIAAQAEKARGDRHTLAAQPGYRANPWTWGSYVYTFDQAPSDNFNWWFSGEGTMQLTGNSVPTDVVNGTDLYKDTVQNMDIYRAASWSYTVPDDQVLIIDRIQLYYLSYNDRLPRKWPVWVDWWWGFWVGSGIVLPTPDEVPSDVATTYSDVWWLGNYAQTNGTTNQLHFVFGPGQTFGIGAWFWRYWSHEMYPILKGNTLHYNMIDAAVLAK